MLCVISNGIIGQSVYVDPCSLLKYAIAHDRVDTFDYYLNLPDSTMNKPNLLSMKVYALVKSTKMKIRNVDISIIHASDLLLQRALDIEDDSDRIHI